ncbi:hypothetical protein CPB83DRAFT_841068 [Crepidotus variabilis]|uniref:Uncharacterized protein n=1 Tax=Crepidotus variabilis TaxID=179855 RepID=A0A9P6E388_9AGAR|nr:hypothetical protein CPB83DRAFT_841068 [Crepidotus variabilis]
MARYLLSIDDSFTDTGEGNTSKISYREDYRFFMNFFINVQHKNPAWWHKLAQCWNVEVLGISEKSAKAAKQGSRTLSDTHAAQKLADELAEAVAMVQIGEPLSPTSDSESFDFSAVHNLSPGPGSPYINPDENLDTEDIEDIYGDLVEPEIAAAAAPPGPVGQSVAAPVEITPAPTPPAQENRHSSRQTVLVNSPAPAPAPATSLQDPAPAVAVSNAAPTRRATRSSQKSTTNKITSAAPVAPAARAGSSTETACRMSGQHPKLKEEALRRHSGPGNV